MIVIFLCLLIKCIAIMRMTMIKNLFLNMFVDISHGRDFYF